MDKQTLIIVIVAGSLVGLVVLFWSARSLARACRRQKTPIPQPQVLRHQAQTFSSRPATVYDSTLVAPVLPFDQSRTSLVSVGLHPPSVDGTAESGSDLTSRTPMDLRGNPHPSFHLVSPSASSFHSGEVSPTVETHDTHDSGSTSAHQRRARSHTRSAGSRTSSMYGTSRPSSLVVSNSRHTLRGLPHGPFSNVQIVLPTPLAPSADIARGRPQSMRPQSMFSNHRLSMVDTWAPTPVRSEHPQMHKSKSASHIAEPRSSTSSNNSGKLRVSSSRRSSTSSISPSPSPSPLSASYSPDEQEAPPVPRIPSIYNTLNYPPSPETSALGQR
ncbi:hypothetical protein DL96DRAFT_1702382 [Flagelloscypha sp. PMI_526]|nr:hypothetical protein DL96DRAFT_1702382 [Flagelloscypha sp. PMI_526]